MSKLNILIKDKKGFSLSGWAETALIATLFMLLFIALIAEMNVKYGKNIDGTLGMSSLLDTTKGNMSAYQNTLQQSVATGQADSSGLGISLSTTWNIISAGATIIWGFLTGGWIQQLVGNTKAPKVVSDFLQIIFVLSVGFIILKLVLKLKP